MYTTYCLMNENYCYSESQESTSGIWQKQRTLGPREGKGLEQSHQWGESQELGIPGASLATSLHPRGQEPDSPLVPRRMRQGFSSHPALQAAPPATAFHLPSSWLRAPHPVLVTPEPGLLAPAGAGQAGEAATRWSRPAEDPPTAPPRLLPVCGDICWPSPEGHNLCSDFCFNSDSSSVQSQSCPTPRDPI